MLDFRKILRFLAVVPVALLFSCNPEPLDTPEEEEIAPYEDDGKIVFLDFGSKAGFAHVPTTEEMIPHWDMMHVTACVQGIVNRDQPRMYIAYSGSNGATDKYWWDMYRQPGKWLSGEKVSQMTDIIEVVKHFRPLFKGLVVYDGNVYSTSNVASTIAGVEDLIAVRYDKSEGSMYNRLKALGLNEKVWLVNEDGSSKFKSKTEPYEWAVENYLATGKCTGEYAGYYIDQFWNHHVLPNVSTKHHQLANHDFFISKRAFFFDLSPWGDETPTDVPTQANKDLETMKKILLAIYNLNGGQKFCHIGGFPMWTHKYTKYRNESARWYVGGKHGEVDTEWEFVRVASAYNAFIDADAAGLGDLSNASFWTHYPLREEYPQKWVTREELKEKGYIKPDGKVDTSKEYMIFYVGDYDSAAWLSNQMQSMWRDAGRGSIPLMWAISPVLADRVPHVMDYLRTTATDNDFFVAADNGAGYLNPSMLLSPRRISSLPSGIDAWAEHCLKYYTRWGITISGFVIDGFANGMSAKGYDAYLKFSPNGVVPQKIVLTDKEAFLYKGMPVMKEESYPGGSPDEAAASILARMTSRTIPFHWFRTVLQTPSWHKQVLDRLQQSNPDIVLLDAPSYFELLRCYLEENKDNIIE